MSNFQIQVFYTTGDSFGSEDTDTILNIGWGNLEIAKENVTRIEEHYELYELINNSYRSWGKDEQKQSRIAELQSRDWYRADKYDKEGFFSLSLKLDNGETYAQSVSWCGYFETLNHVQIKVC